MHLETDAVDRHRRIRFNHPLAHVVDEVTFGVEPIGIVIVVEKLGIGVCSACCPERSIDEVWDAVVPHRWSPFAWEHGLVYHIPSICLAFVPRHHILDVAFKSSNKASLVSRLAKVLHPLT